MTKLSRREVLIASIAAGTVLGRGAAARAASGGDPVLIPAGPFLKGTAAAQAQALAARLGHHPSWLLEDAPQQELWLPAFWIDRFPVTNLRYQQFCRQTGHPAPPDFDRLRLHVTCPNHPVVGVNQADARAFAAWDGAALPTEAQWEKAARGTDGRLFPWGDTFDPDACNHDRGGPAPPPGLAAVDAHPLGASPYGVEDMIGNAAEWCLDGPSPTCAWIKGGAWVTASPATLRCAARGLSGAANNRLTYLGFRCVRGA